MYICLYNLYNPVLLGTSDIVSFISNTSREYKYFYFRRFNNYTIVFISEIVIQNSDTLRLSKWHRIKQIKNTS